MCYKFLHEMKRLSVLFVLFCAFNMLHAQFNEMFLGKPYLQNPVNKGITIMCETSSPSYCWVEYGMDTLQMTRVRTIVDGQVVCNKYLHKIRLENLETGRIYYYRVCAQEMRVYEAYYKKFGDIICSKFYTFSLPSEDKDSFTAVIFNDLHKRLDTFNKLYQQIDSLDYDFVVFNGDCIDDPNSYEQVTDFLSKVLDRIKGYSIPTFFIRGNHEIRNSYSIELRRHFDYVDDRTFFAFNWGDTRFVVLDCGEDKPDSHPVYYGLNDFSSLRKQQTDFMKHEFSSRLFKKAKVRILLHHIPFYGNTEENQCNGIWNECLDNASFDVCLNGHTHQFAYHPKGKLGNNFPVIIGGGPEPDNSTVAIIKKEKKKLSIVVLDSKGNILLKLSEL